MGTVASGKDGERDASESSGYSDLMEIANALGIEDDDAAHDDADVADDLEPVGAGYGGAAAAALVTDASAETPAANVPEPRREPPPPPPRRTSSTLSPVAPASEPSGPIVAVPDPAAPAAARSNSDDGAAAALLRPSSAPVIPASESAAVSRTAAVSLTAAPAASSLAGRPVAVTPPPRQEEKKSGAMIWMVAAGVLALGGVGWYVTQGNGAADKKVAAADVRPAGPAADEQAEADRLAAQAAAKKAEADRLAAEAAAKTEADRLAAEAAATAEADRLEQERLAAEAAAAAAAAEAATVEVSVTQKKKDKNKAEPTAAAEPEPEPKAPPVKAEPLTPGEIDEKFRAECVLNPNKAGCEELRKKQRNTHDLDATLSDKLTQSQIREGFSKVKGKAKACGGEAGVTVHVKVSIAGSSGDVISINALDDHAGTALGKCVVDALKGASFPRFTSESQGTVYPVSF